MSKKIQIREVGGAGDVLTAEISDNSLHIECEQPWVGDTETGFGSSGAVTLTKEQARQLAAFLLAWAEEA